MKKWVLLILFFSVLSSFGQSLDGIWMDSLENKFLKISNDSCFVIAKSLKENDSRYFAFLYKIKYLRANRILIIDEYFIDGLVFWAQKDKTKFKYILKDGDILLLEFISSNEKIEHNQEIIGVTNSDYFRVDENILNQKTKKIVY